MPDNSLFGKIRACFSIKDKNKALLDKIKVRRNRNKNEKIDVETQKQNKKEDNCNNSEENNNNLNTFKLFDKSSNTVLEVNDKDFLYGAVVCEMSPTFEIEALKAQAVATYTYFCRERNASRVNPKEDLKGADFEVDVENWKYYTTKDKMMIRWGENFDLYYKKISLLRSVK